MPREYFKGTWQEDYSFSPAVATRGGKIVWLAGVGAETDDEGNSLAGKFEEQVHTTFRRIGQTLERAGGKLQDIVTMTAFILDVRHVDNFVGVRKQYFPEGFPSSALITVAGFAHPDMMVEVQAIAVVEE
ncbi:MAG: RidA family protein [Nitrospinota bacterium]